MAYQEYLNVRDRVAFGQGPYTQTPTWTDITRPDSSNSNAVRPGGTFATGRQSRNGQFEATSVTLQVGNRDGRYTPYFAGSPYYPLTESAPYQRHVEYPKSSGTWYPIWGGVMSDCTADFEGAASGTAQLTFQQVLGITSKRPLKSLAVATIMALEPTHFWPLDDLVGTVEAADARGSADYDTLELQYSTAGVLTDEPTSSPSGLGDFGSGFAPGDTAGTRLALTPDAAAPANGYILKRVLTGSTGTHQDTAMTVSLTELTAGAPAVIYSLFSTANSIGIRVTASTTSVVVSVVNSSAVVSTPVTYAANIVDGEDHSIGTSITVSGTTATVKLYVDGTLGGSGTFTAWTGAFGADTIGIGLNVAYADSVQPLSGSVANVAMWNDADVTRHTSTYAESTFGFDGDLASERLPRLLGAAGLRVTSTMTGLGFTIGGISTSASTLGTFDRLIAPQNTIGRTLVDVLRELEASEIGRLSINHSGQVVLASNKAFHSPIRTLTLSANTHFDIASPISRDSDNLINEWSGTRIDGVPQYYSASDAVIDEQGLQTTDGGTLPLGTDDDVLAVGAWKVNTSATPTLRLTIRVHGAKLHAAGLLDDALLLSEGDQVILTNLPTGSPVTSFTGFVERIAKVFTKDNLTFEITLSQWLDIAEYNSATIGRYAEDEGSITLTSTVTSSATSISATTAATHPPLTNVAGNLPFDISLAGERCTVTAVSAATSPQTLTVTRGVAPTTAVAHTAGATISIWNPGVFGV